MVPSCEEYHWLIWYSLSFFKPDCHSCKQEFSAGEAKGVVGSAILASWSLFSFLWVIAHTFFCGEATLNVTQTWPCSPSWALGCSAWLAVGIWPMLIGAELMLGFFKNLQEEGFSPPSGPGTMLMLAWRNEVHHENLPCWEWSNTGWQGHERREATSWQLHLSRWIQPVTWVMIARIIYPRCSMFGQGRMTVYYEVFVHSWWNGERQVQGNEFFGKLAFNLRDCSSV